MFGNDVTILVLSSAALFFLVTSFLGYFVILYRNRQLINKQEQEKLQDAFKLELLKTQLEVQEDTMEYISRELHDNVNQVLSFVKLNLGLIKCTDDGIAQKVTESAGLIGETIIELRNLSQSLSFERISRLGLAKSITTEIERIQKSGIINTGLVVNGEIYPLGEQRELVFFRIFQEALNNIFKHAKATTVKIALHYQPRKFMLMINDDGEGFLPETTVNNDSSGLTNIRNRAKMVGADAVINSRPGDGCIVTISLHINNNNT